MKFSIRSLALLPALFSAPLSAQELWTDPADAGLPADFSIQGEYAGEVGKKGGQAAEKLGAQVIALGAGRFQAVLHPGGLPGAGWDGKNKSLLDGRLDGQTARFEAAEGKRKYLAKSADEFSATESFPPTGQQSAKGTIAEGRFTGTLADGRAFTLERTVRKSPTLGAKPPTGAIVLFDGTKVAMKNWSGGRFDEKTGFLNTDGKDIRTSEQFLDYTMHIEFLLPFKPGARGQGRGNSGFYQVDLYEMQILDSFGLAGMDNECGGIYKTKRPAVNMCLPPLQWQSYDVEFTSARVGDDGKKTANAVLTAKLNGVMIHDGLEIPGKTGGSRKDPEGTPGPIKLQGHGNPLQFRNVWIVPKR